MHIPLVLFEYCRRFGMEGIIAQSTFLDWANGYETIYKKHKNDPLLKNPEWYPTNVKKYRELYEKVASGEDTITVHDYFFHED